MISKRYKDIFDQYIYRNEKTPWSFGTLAICALCFLMLLVAIFTRFSISHYWIDFKNGFEITTKTVNYGLQIPVMVFIIYILRQAFSIITFTVYLLVGFFIWPIFVYGGGLEYFKNYLFGYMLGFFVAVFIAEFILKKGGGFRSRLLMAISCVVAIHICGFLYCIILALFGIIDFNLVSPIVSATSGNKIMYDLVFSIAIIIIAPYIKNILWVPMKPKFDKSKKFRLRRTQNMLENDIR